VLSDARASGADAFVLGGDYALFGAWPAETVARLRTLTDAAWIRGNGERWTAHPSEAPDLEVVQGAIAACAAELGERTVGELAALPEQDVIDGARYCHGSPLSDVRSFGSSPASGSVGEDVELLAGVLEHRVVFGHTHVQFRRPGPDGIDLINPGSVGMPFDGDPRAAWMLIGGDGAVELRRIGYDHHASARAVAERFGESPFTRTVAARIEQARLDVPGP
jgi:diadenosine tetraphosphatase ApaH/serine/threonine PP2A family protein phosphatase